MGICWIRQGISDELIELSTKKRYNNFTDVLIDIDKHTSLNTRQLDVLIKIDYFSDFGNQRELLRITDMFYNIFKKGEAKKINKDKIEGTPIEDIVKKYAVGITKSGVSSKSYTLLDVVSIMRETETYIKNLNMSDLSDIIKVRNFFDMMGYIGYTSGKEEDRRKLYVTGIYPLSRKKDNKQFGYSVLTKSIGSGKDGRFTVFNKIFNENPIEKDDIIFCKSFARDGQYFQLTSYEKVT